MMFDDLCLLKEVKNCFSLIADLARVMLEDGT